VPQLGAFRGRGLSTILPHSQSIDLIRDNHAWIMGEGCQLVRLGSGQVDLEGRGRMSWKVVLQGHGGAVGGCCQGCAGLFVHILHHHVRTCLPTQNKHSPARAPSGRVIARRPISCERPRRLRCTPSASSGHSSWRLHGEAWLRTCPGTMLQRHMSR